MSTFGNRNLSIKKPQGGPCGSDGMQNYSAVSVSSGTVSGVP